MLKKMLIPVLAILLTGGLLFSAPQGQIKYEGKLLQVSGIWFLKTADDIYGLDLAQLKDQNLVLAAGEMISVSGEIINDVINVQFLQKGEIIYEITQLKTEDYQGFRVNPDRCISCNLCVKKCPVGAISMVNGKAVIDTRTCIQCGICKNGNGMDWKGCPGGAISNDK